MSSILKRYSALDKNLIMEKISYFVNAAQNLLACSMGSAIGGGRGGHGPPPIQIGGGPVMYLAPQFLGKILLCIQLMYSVFL